MREILFRGKSLINNNWEWVYGYYAPTYLFSKDGENNHTYCIVSDDCIKTHEMLGCGVQSGLPMSYKVKRETLGQFTGLLDKNGKKIFEGDIVRVYSDCEGYHTYKTHLHGVVKYDSKYSFEYVVSFDHIHNCCEDSLSKHRDNIEVIGNIHDNPELLNQIASEEPEENFILELNYNQLFDQKEFEINKIKNKGYELVKSDFDYVRQIEIYYFKLKKKGEIYGRN